LIVNPPVKFTSDSFQSTLVSIEPQTIAYFPLTFNENKLGVLELAWPDYKSASEIELTSDAIETLCARLFHVISQQKITSLYEEAQDKSAQLEEKESSLRQYITELEEAQLLMGRMQDSLEDTVKQRTSELENTLIELKAAQNQIVQSEKLASLGQLVAGVAHEINTPIGIAVTAASYLQTNTDELNEAFSGGKMKKSDFEDYLEQARECSILILKNLERASQLIQSFKKVAVNQSSENVYEFDLGEYLNEILTSLRPQLRKTRVEYDVDCPEELLITSSSSAISQIVINLVMNSLLHAFDPNQQGLLSIVVEDKGKKAMIRYSDNGKGIPHDIIDKIFDPFFTTRRGSGGSGLGLNIVHNLASQMLKGSVRCTSELGKGTSFFIEFPKQIQ